MNISVMDMMRYVGSKGTPISALAIRALLNKLKGRTIVMTEEENKDDELYQSIKLEKYRWRHYDRTWRR